MRPMDWFERLTGFHEDDPHATRAPLAVEGSALVSLVNGARYGNSTRDPRCCTRQ
jgi:hypothetical protein